MLKTINITDYLEKWGYPEESEFDSYKIISFFEKEAYIKLSLSIIVDKKTDEFLYYAYDICGIDNENEMRCLHTEKDPKCQTLTNVFDSAFLNCFKQSKVFDWLKVTFENK